MRRTERVERDEAGRSDAALPAARPDAVAPAAVDRSAAERDEPGLLDAVLSDPGTRVMVVHGALAAHAAGDEPRLQSFAPADVPAGAEWGFLGRAADGAAVVVAAFDPATPAPLDAHGWAGPREIGAALDEHAADTLMVAISLGRWLTDFGHCPLCGGRAVLRQAGWSRRCEDCGREHFPRNDPAVIVAITDPARERILLGANVNWRGRMHSCFAGFVEAGESLETAIHRELFEEAGVRVTDVRYVRSQPWPFPHSLMLGFEATAVDPDEARPDGTEIISLKWFTRDEIAEALAGRGEFGLPGRASIAYRLIREWHDE
ncbi:NAD(+) diphosphatase [Microbacterium stercoris]|uniref:NAD(+) diphosphatase n=1 Tax=Microbacterium stercoris TaxID=2820289 RepID=A0A939QG74_9MICO|nr:NAD(+) diphosphatase [Microbacterium stercoris]MBO3662332.1 NAD(+) diphosphatase [Microbacterium stercoris]MBO3664324.1 NAD(+) diphosphatase [Microbacterium stercoris]